MTNDHAGIKAVIMTILINSLLLTEVINNKQLKRIKMKINFFNLINAWFH